MPDSLENFELPDIFNHFLKERLKRLSALIASLNLSEFQIASDSIQESSDELRDGKDIDVFSTIRGFDWSNGLGESHGCINTCIEVRASGPILMLF